MKAKKGHENDENAYHIAVYSNYARESIEYLKQIYQEINKELEIFMKFHKNGKIEVPGRKWNFNLIDDKTK